MTAGTAERPEAGSTGSVEVGGTQIAGLGLDELNGVRKKIGFLFQQAALYDSMTV